MSKGWSFLKGLSLELCSSIFTTVLIPMSAKPNEKNLPFSSHKSEALYKLKAAAQQEANQSDSSTSSKRPRGRPPLVSSKPKLVSKATPPVVKAIVPAANRLLTAVPQPKIVGNFVAANSTVQYPAQPKPAPIIPPAPMAVPLGNQNQVPASNATVVDTTVGETGGEQQSKAPKPSATEVTNKLIAVLMVSDPTSVADLCKQLPELPRESIQSVLEVLQVLGLVIQMMSSKETGSKSSSASNIVYLYALAEFAKFNAAFPITQLQAETRAKQEATQEVRGRVDVLQALSVSLEDESLDQETRQGLMHEVLNKLVQQNPALWEDPLYQAMLEHGRPSSPLDALLM